jgi:hypothetical protein
MSLSKRLILSLMSPTDTAPSMQPSNLAAELKTQGGEATQKVKVHTYTQMYIQQGWNLIRIAMLRLYE